MVDYSERQRKWVRCNEIMLVNGFGYDLRRRSLIWASKHQKCPSCKAPKFHPCLHLYDVKRGIENPRINRQPHEDRIDWALLEKALWDRGYRI